MSGERIGKWLLVRRTAQRPKRKTGIWIVMGNDGNALGRIEWYGAWRQYVIVPKPDTVWNAGCLKDVAAFLDKTNREHITSGAAFFRKGKEARNGG